MTSTRRSRSARARAPRAAPTLAFILAACAFAPGCKKRGFNTDSDRSGAASTSATAFRMPPDFCDERSTEATVDLARRDEPGHVWGAAEVQAHITGLIKSWSRTRSPRAAS